jgi:hypothetical protein
LHTEKQRHLVLHRRHGPLKTLENPGFFVSGFTLKTIVALTAQLESADNGRPPIALRSDGFSGKASTVRRTAKFPGKPTLTVGRQTQPLPLGDEERKSLRPSDAKGSARRWSWAELES